MHPAGGQEKVDEHGNLIWIPDKTKWAAPEGTQPPPNVNPLAQQLNSACESSGGLSELKVVNIT